LFDHQKIRQAVTMLLEAIGEDPGREGLRDTPGRVARMYEEIFSGLYRCAQDEIDVFFAESYDELVLVKDIPFYSMCEHHLLPFFGKIHIAYIPKNGRITGLSKLVRAAETVARRPQVQERMTEELARAVVNALDPEGVAVVVEAEHMCMTMRGVSKPGSRTITSAVLGIFRKNKASRAEVLSLIRGKQE